MKTKFFGALILISANAFSQSTTSSSVMDPLSFEVILDDPSMKDVSIKKDVTFLKDEKGSLNMDLYVPPNVRANQKLPAIIFLNAIGDRAGARKVKNWGIYTSWPRLMATKGYVGISMDADASRIQESIQAIFDFIDKKGSAYNIDKDKLGVYAASANVTESFTYLMKNNAYPGIKAAVLYYGGQPAGPYRKDLPVFFVISEGDVQRNGYTTLWNEVLKNNAPWTIKMGTGMPHAFDAYTDNDEARKIVKETISFWKNYLDPVPAPSWPHSKAREALALLRTEPQKAIPLLKSLADENPGDALTLSFYAATLHDAKRDNEAEIVYKKLLAIEPGNLIALLSMSNIKFGQNDDEAGKKYLTEAENTGLMTAGNYGGVGYNLIVLNRNKEAARYYEKAVALEPNSRDYYNLACAYAKDKETDKAMNALEKSIQLGTVSKNQILNDTDLDSLRSDSRYKALLEKLSNN